SVVDPDRLVPAASIPHPVLGFSSVPETRIVPPCQVIAAGSVLPAAAVAPPVLAAGRIHMVGGSAGTRAGRAGGGRAAPGPAPPIRSSSVHRWPAGVVAVAVIGAATASTRACETGSAQRAVQRTRPSRSSTPARPG